MTGYAEQATNWKEGAGGNVSAGTWGKLYSRVEPWEFEITRMTGL